MSGSFARRLVTSVVALVTAVSGGIALPVAFAATAGPTASLVSGKFLLSGTQGNHVVVRVDNPTSAAGGSGLAVNQVRVTPPPGFSITGGSANGWIASQRLFDSSWEFDPAPSLSGLGVIAPGSHADFTLDVTAAPQAGDLSGVWKVSTSTTAGQTLDDAAASKPGALTGWVKVLAPSRPVVDFLTATGKVTSGQDNVTVTYALRSYGTAPLSVTPQIFGSAGDAALGTQSAVTILPGQSVTLHVPVVFGSPGTQRTLAAGGSAAGAQAFSLATAPYDVQVPATFGYDGSTPLTPTSGRSGDAPTYSLTLAKAGDPDVHVATSTQLAFTNPTDTTKSWSAPSPGVDVPAGADSRRYSFVPTTIPGSPTLADFDGTYDTSVHVVGTDANGAVVDQVVAVTTPFTVDNIAPLAAPTLAAPNRAGVDGGSRNDPSQPYVAKSGDQLTIGGSVVTGPGSGTPDGTATVSCAVESFDATSASLGSQPVSCANNGGTLSGSPAPTYPAGAATAQLLVTTTDAAGNSATTSSGTILVDDVAPRVQRARTACGAGAATGCTNSTTIRVYLSEPVTGAFSPSDFTVTDGTTVGVVSAVTFTGTDTTYGTQAVLTLARSLSPDARPKVAFRSTALTPPTDAPGNAVVAGTVTAADGIPPALPAFSAVSGKAPWSGDGRYYTNEPSPAYGLTNVTAGATLTVYADTDGQPGLQTASDQVLCQVTASASADTTCTDPSRALAADGTYTIFVQAVDPNGNRSLGRDGTPSAGQATLILDRTPPTIAGFTSQSDGVLVTFSEIVVSGRDYATDWSVTAGPVSWTVGSVTAVDLTHRKLGIADQGWDGSVSRVGYAFRGSTPAQRYMDLAGNLMPDNATP